MAFADTDASALAATLIKQDLFKNQDKIREIARDLTLDERTMLYDECQKNLAVPFMVNLVVGFGIGSFIEGDTTGGLIALAGDGVGYMLVFTGAILTLSNSFGLANFGAGLLYFGIASVVGVRIFETTRTIKYADTYNTVLKKSLNKFEVGIALPAERKFAELSLSCTKSLN
jgi:hypothetical protein